MISSFPCHLLIHQDSHYNNLHQTKFRKNPSPYLVQYSHSWFAFDFEIKYSYYPLCTSISILLFFSLLKSLTNLKKCISVAQNFPTPSNRLYKFCLFVLKCLEDFIFDFFLEFSRDPITLIFKSILADDLFVAYITLIDSSMFRNLCHSKYQNRS